MRFYTTVGATTLLFGAVQVLGGCAPPGRGSPTTLPVVRISASHMLSNAAFGKNHKSLLGRGVIYSPRGLPNRLDGLIPVPAVCIAVRQLTLVPSPSVGGPSLEAEFRTKAAAEIPGHPRARVIIFRYGFESNSRIFTAGEPAEFFFNRRGQCYEIWISKCPPLWEKTLRGTKRAFLFY